MTIQAVLSQAIEKAIKELFTIDFHNIEFQATRKDFEGDITMVVFPLLKVLKSNPVALGNQIGEYLVAHVVEVERFNVVSGFLNIVISDQYYLSFLNAIKGDEQYGFVQPAEGSKSVMVEYSSPNTNKPLHLGHVRNNLLGYSVAEILKASGKKVNKTQIINDRGIHICKSMLAWQKFGKGQTPESTGLKGDKLVGNFYVEFDKAYKTEIGDLVAKGLSEENAKKEAPLFKEAQNMLQLWEAGDEEVVALWKTMNQWVYDGFSVTYKNLGVDFDSIYYESDTYLLGKDVIEEGLSKGVFYRKEDGSVWIDLSDEGLDEKLVLRSDGTAVYMTQDIGTAIQRVKDFTNVGGMVYTVGNEQDYHFKVLFLILKRLGYDWAEQLYHLSYGMVDLPSGKMKSREGTVVDADDLMQDMTDTAAKISEELGKLDGYNQEEKNALYKIIGMGALKYYLLKVDPKKTILFNPEESVDFNGNTGPFIQYTYARIQSILRKADFDCAEDISGIELHEKEKELIKQLALYPDVIQQAANQYSPAIIANYTYDLVKGYNSFYQSVSILGEDDTTKKIFRVQLSKKVAETIKSAFSLLGIDVPNRM
ncbi:MAG: arginine--tRNA ligase [Flavobacteriales bacterium]|nr:arginine--tRNA ligase [Flavobacteriales bacterium]